MAVGAITTVRTNISPLPEARCHIREKHECLVVGLPKNKAFLVSDYQWLRARYKRWRAKTRDG
jgi:hypothetical protein